MTQHSKILNLLKDNKNNWVSLPEILHLGIAQYNARILELRALGHKIENKTQEVEGVRHSWYRLVVEPNQQEVFSFVSKVREYTNVKI